MLFILIIWDVFCRILPLMLMGSPRVIMLTVICQKLIGKDWVDIKTSYFYFLLLSYVDDLAASNDYFIEEFSKVYEKLISTGYSGLQTVS